MSVEKHISRQIVTAMLLMVALIGLPAGPVVERGFGFFEKIGDGSWVTWNSAAASPLSSQPVLAENVFDQVYPVAEDDPAYRCLESRWRGTTYGLKDHTIFYADGFYYGVSIYHAPYRYEDQFAYARSADLCSWTELSPILTERTPGTWDEFQVWAPHVIKGQSPETADTYFMFFTGVTRAGTQSIMLATTTTPHIPESWVDQGVTFQPHHDGMIWPGWGKWADARDPMVLWAHGRYYLYYTGLDVDGGIVGAAVADNPFGPWEDLGAIVTTPGAIPESPTVMERDGFFFLAFNRTVDHTGPVMSMGLSAVGPWSEAWPLTPGWAHEFFQSVDGHWLTSYLTTYEVTVDLIDWEQRGTIYYPVLRIPPNRIYLPQITGQPQPEDSEE